MTDVRTEVRDWLTARHRLIAPEPAPFENPSTDYLRWLAEVFDGGWAVPEWPSEWWGRGLSSADTDVIVEEFERAGAPGAARDRTSIPVAVIWNFGGDDLRRELLPGLLTGLTGFCLLYSEPAAGSDLAGVRTTATRTDEGWRVSGQKVWTSGAMESDIGLLLARTDWDLPKHQGLSFFVCPMRQDGVTVRPLRQITDESHFNEVYLDDALVPSNHLLGQEGAGWSVLQVALAVERLLMGGGVGEILDAGPGADPVGDLLELARTTGGITDPVIRQEMATVLGHRACNDLNMARAAADTSPAGMSVLSVAKLAMSRILHSDAALRTRLLGIHSLLDGPEAPEAADTNHRTFMAYMTSIGGGTDQVQRNIIGEKVLGLPREPSVDRGVPFREIPSG